MLGWLKIRRKRMAAAPACTAGQHEANKALDAETRKLQAIRKETRTIRATAEVLKGLGEQNDFAGRLRDAMGGTG